MSVVSWECFHNHLYKWQKTRTMRSKKENAAIMLWIVCRKRGLLRGTEKFSLGGLNQGITTFLRWDRMLLSEQPSAAHCPHSFLALSLLQDSTLSQRCILRVLKYHVVKKVIPKKIFCQGHECPVLDYLPVLPSQQFVPSEGICGALQERQLAGESTAVPFIAAALRGCHLLPVCWH